MKRIRLFSAFVNLSILPNILVSSCLKSHYCRYYWKIENSQNVGIKPTSNIALPGFIIFNYVVSLLQNRLICCKLAVGCCLARSSNAH
jgi:hypothetical protein